MKKLCLLTALAATGALLLAQPSRADTTNLIFATTEPAGSDDSMHVFSPWAAQIGKATNDAIHIDLREGFAIANSTNIYDRVQGDVVQVGILIPSHGGGKFPLTDAVGLPLSPQDRRNASVASGGSTRPACSIPNTRTSCLCGFGLPAAGRAIRQGAGDDNLQGLRTARRRQAIERARSAGWRDTAGARSERPIHGARAPHHRRRAEPVDEHGTAAFDRRHRVSRRDLARHGHVHHLHGARKIRSGCRPATRQGTRQFRRIAEPRDRCGRGAKCATASRATAVADPAKHTIVQLSPAQTKTWAQEITPVIDDWTSSHQGGAALLANYRSRRSRPGRRDGRSLIAAQGLERSASGCRAGGFEPPYGGIKIFAALPLGYAPTRVGRDLKRKAR